MTQSLPHDVGTGQTGPEIRVSYHAVTRYVQRILRVTVDQDFKDEKQRARHHCMEAGTTIRNVRCAIWTPGIALAVRMGVTQVSNGQFGVVIDPDTGVIATVIEPRSKHACRTDRLKLLSEREYRQKARRHNRNNRHSPKGAALRDADEGNEYV
tara:strand:- start:13978 stop:14439 length:462 start_codon:yes stop_codon:yes gene_type:complete